MFTYDQIKSLNELEMSVYNYVIRNKEKVIYMKIRELAACSNVSTTTVLRFCKNIGCEGYQEFKLKLKLHLKKDSEILPDTDISAMMDYFLRVETKLYQSGLEQVLNIVMKSSEVLFIGTGTSGILGKYGARCFNNAGKLSFYIDDPFTPVHQGENRTVAVIALSVSGTTEQTLLMAGNLKNRGCVILSITNSAKSHLAQMSDCSINYYTPTIRLGTHIDLTSQIPVMFIIETLGRRLHNLRKNT